MTRTLSNRPVRSRLAWTIGTMVLVALIGVVVWMLQGERRLAARLADPQAVKGPAPDAPAPAPEPLSQLIAKAAIDATMRGVVSGPSGQPVSGATVTVHRLTTTWPEWRRESKDFDRAFTNQDGGFQFRIADLRGLLVSVTHPQFAERLLEVPLHGEPMDVRLEPGFELTVVVTNEAGTPMANAHVAIESIPGDDRRVVVMPTSANGSCRFSNVAAGPVRLVAHHDAWQPVSLSMVVVGGQRPADLRFSRPASAPLMGRVISAGTTAPVVDAVVELLPLSGKLGLVDTQAVRTDRNGEFLLAGLARGSMRLLVRHPEHGAVMMTQPLGVVAPALVVEMPRRSLVTGRMVVDAGAPLWRAGESLLLRDASGQIGFATIAADGSFRFPASLSPGWASLRLLEPSFAFQRSYTTDVDVRIDEAVATELELPVIKPTVLRGRLVDSAARPLVGAALLRTKPSAEGSRIADAAAQFDLGSVGRQVARLFESDRDELLATTDQNGCFVIRGVKPGSLYVRTLQRGFGSRWLREVIGGVGTERDLGTIELPRGMRLQGQVLRGGRPFAGAVVAIVDPVDGQTKATAITDAGGGWAADDLMPGDYRVRARSPGQSAGGRARSVPVRVGERSTNVVIGLDPGRIVRGNVIGSDSQPVAGAIVAVRDAASTSVTTDGDGDFELELPERTGELQVSLADRSSPRIVAVPLREQRLLVQLDTPPTSTIIASIAGLPGQKRLSSAVLNVQRLDAEADGETRGRWVELIDGELRWPLCPTGLVRIEVRADGYAPVVLERELEANKEHRLGDLLLEPGCRLAGVVRRADGAPIANASVMVGEECDVDLFDANTRSAADGSFRITGISGRSSRLVVRAIGFAPRVVDLVLPRDTLAREPLLITLEAGASIEVTVPRAIAREGGFVRLRRDGRFVANVELTDDTKVVFANRSAGSYSVSLVGDPRPPKSVVVEPGATRVTVQLP